MMLLLQRPERLMFGYWLASGFGRYLRTVESLTFASAATSALVALAPSFDGQKNQIQALKVAVYASTATWVISAHTGKAMPGCLRLCERNSQ